METDPVPASDQVLTPAKRGGLKRRGSIQDREQTELRREIVGHLYCVRRLPIRHIQRYLREQVDPPIIVESLTTISRDIQAWRANARRIGSARHFDALGEVWVRVQGYNTIMRRAYDESISSADPRIKLMAYKRYIEASQAATDLLQDVGLLDRRIGTIVIDDRTGASTRMPSGEEIQKRFESITVVEAELIPEARRAWLYGDAAEAEKAAQDDRS